MANVPNFTLTPNFTAVGVSAANPNRDGTGTIVSIVAAPPNGMRIESILISATGTTTEGVVRLFLSDGVSTFLIKEIPVQANTVSATNPAWRAHIGVNSGDYIFPMSIQSGITLKATTEKSETFIINVFGGSF